MDSLTRSSQDKLRGNDKGEEWKAENYLRFADFFCHPNLIRGQGSRTG